MSNYNRIKDKNEVKTFMLCHCSLLPGVICPLQLYITDRTEHFVAQESALAAYESLVETTD